jgi:hypothetical protein
MQAIVRSLEKLSERLLPPKFPYEPCGFCLSRCLWACALVREAHDHEMLYDEMCKVQSSATIQNSLPFGARARDLSRPMSGEVRLPRAEATNSSKFKKPKALESSVHLNALWQAPIHRSSQVSLSGCLQSPGLDCACWCSVVREDFSRLPPCKCQTCQDGELTHRPHNTRSKYNLYIATKKSWFTSSFLIKDMPVKTCMWTVPGRQGVLKVRGTNIHK